MTSRLGDLLRDAQRELAALPAGALEAEILLAHSLDAPRSFLYANPELDLPRHRREAFRGLLRRRLQGEPIAYITGTREFWSLPLRITPDVLIPRSETETLVEAALARIPAEAGWRIADLGTGSGAIALALAKERPRCEVHATERSAAALAVARDNAANLDLGRVVFHHGDWAAPLRGSFELMASNPPYVAADDPHLARGDCRFEPHGALTPGPDALAAIRTIAQQAVPMLAPGGWLLFEHGADQGEGARGLLENATLREIFTVRDLRGRERVSGGRKPA